MLLWLQIYLYLCRNRPYAWIANLCHACRIDLSLILLMSAWSPTVEGFRTIFRRPALSLAEISWRWSFGAAACLLAVFGLFEYLDTLPVSTRDLFLLRSGAPAFVSRALAHILRGSGFRLLLAMFIVFSALAVLWIVIVSIGRAATLPPLLESIRTRARASAAPTPSEGSSTNLNSEATNHPVRSLAGLHFLRVVVFGLAAFALVGAAFAASILSPKDDPHPGIAFFFFFLLAILIFLAVTSLNWLLSLAALFVVRDGEDSFGAISAAMDLCRDRIGAVSAVGTWFGLAHLTFFVIASSVLGFPLSLLRIVPPGFVLLGVLLVTLLYLAAADALYIGRLAGYAAILEAPPPPVQALPLADASVPHPPFLQSGPAFADSPSLKPVTESTQTAVDQTELIVSDRPDASTAPEKSEENSPPPGSES